MAIADPNDSPVDPNGGAQYTAIDDAPSAPAPSEPREKHDEDVLVANPDAARDLALGVAPAAHHPAYKGPTKGFNPQVFAPHQQGNSPAPGPPKGPAAAPGPMSVGDMFREAGKNALPDFGNVLGGLADTVMNLPKTVGTLGQLGVGAASQASGYLPFVHQDPAQKQKNEALIKGVEQNYGDRYGSVDKAMHSFASTPFSTAMDASMFIPGLDAGAAAADAAKATAVARGLRVASKALDTVNPVSVAGNVAKGLTKMVPGRTASSILTGVPQKAYAMADVAQKTPLGRAGYKDFMSGAADDGTVQQHAIQAVKDYDDAKKAANDAAMSNLTSNAGPIDFNGFQTDLANMRANAPKGLNAQGVDNDLGAIQDHLEAGSYSPDAQGLDRLRRDLHTAYPGNDAHIGQVRDLIKDTIEAAAPGYKAQLASYAPDQKLVAQMNQQLGAGRMSAADTLNALTRNIGRGRTNFLDEAVSKNPYLGGMLAASHFKPVVNPSHGSLLGAVVGGHAGPLGSVAGAFGQRILGSPRLHGALNTALATAPGRIAPVVKAAASAEKLAGGVDAADPAAPSDPALPAGPAPNSADLFVKNWWMPHEGEWNANDTNGTPSAWGVNKGANPDVDVNKLRSDPDAAANIIKDRVWNKSGADKMPLPLAMVHADTYGNSGPVVAASMLKLSGGDANKYLQLKRDFYKNLLQKNPEKYGKYANAWKTRADDMQAVFDAIGSGGVGAGHASGGMVMGGVGVPVPGPNGDEPVSHSQGEEEPDEVHYYPEASGDKPQDRAAPKNEGHDGDDDGDDGKENVHFVLPSSGGILRAPTKMSTSEQLNYFVEKLMKAAKAAKKETDATTKPLLQAPDSAIAKALDIAQRAL